MPVGTGMFKLRHRAMRLEDATEEEAAAAAGGGAAAAAGGKKLTIEDEILALPKRPAPLMRQLGLQ